MADDQLNPTKLPDKMRHVWDRLPGEVEPGAPPHVPEYSTPTGGKKMTDPFRGEEGSDG